MESRVDIMAEKMYTLNELQELLEKFSKEHPHLHKQEIYERVCDRETTGTEKFLFWLEHGFYDIEYNWSAGSF